MAMPRVRKPRRASVQGRYGACPHRIDAPFDEGGGREREHDGEADIADIEQRR